MPRRQAIATGVEVEFHYAQLQRGFALEVQSECVEGQRLVRSTDERITMDICIGDALP
jgi:hypothetical protein